MEISLAARTASRIASSDIWEYQTPRVRIPADSSMAAWPDLAAASFTTAARNNGFTPSDGKAATSPFRLRRQRRVLAGILTRVESLLDGRMRRHSIGDHLLLPHSGGPLGGPTLRIGAVNRITRLTNSTQAGNRS
jgi:hypothetical protein